MKRYAIILGLALLLISVSSAAFAQNQTRICVNSLTGNNCIPVTSSAPFPVTGTLSTTLTAYTPVTPAAATATNGLLLGGQYNSTQATFTNTQQGSLQISARGALYVATGADTFNIGTVTTVTGITTVSTVTSLSQFGGQAINLGDGTVGTGTLRVTLASNGTGVVAVTQSTSPWVTRLNTTPTIANGSGIVYAPSSESGAAITPVVTGSVATSLVLKNSAGNLYSLNVSADSTLSAAAWWVMVHNATSAPAAGAVTPTKCWAVPTGTTTFSIAYLAPIRFSTGISVTVGTNGCFTQADSAHAFISGDVQ